MMENLITLFTIKQRTVTQHENITRQPLFDPSMKKRAKRRDSRRIEGRER